MRRQTEVSNVVAAALCGAGDQMLRELESQVACDLFLRGNVVTLDGEAEAVAAADVVVKELVGLVEGGHEIGPGPVDAVLSALDQAEHIREALDDVVWRHRGKTIAPKSARSTAPYQTDAPASTVTSPTSVAVGAIQASGWTRGARPSKANSGMAGP